jgi:hypothetical protein
MTADGSVPTQAHPQTDLVERLRYYPTPLVHEAADEIERLRRVVDRAVEWRRHAEPGPIPAVSPQAMNFTTKYNLMQAVDEILS